MEKTNRKEYTVLWMKDISVGKWQFGVRWSGTFLLRRVTFKT